MWLKRILSAIRYQSSEDDRQVLGCLFVVAGVIASIVGIIIFIVLWNGRWGVEVRRDSARLDSILAMKRIDTVVIASWDGTNRITGEEALKMLAALARTNRVGNIDWTKQQAQDVMLLSGTNEIGRLSLG